MEGLPMKCKKTQRMLNRYLDHVLAAGKETALQEHISKCPRCRNKLREMKQLKVLLGTETAYSPNPFLWTRIKAGLQEPNNIPGLFPLPAIIKAWVPLAILIILLAAFTLSRLPGVKNWYFYDKPQSIETVIMRIPGTPENLERISLNFLVYGSDINGKAQDLYF